MFLFQAFLFCVVLLRSFFLSQASSGSVRFPEDTEPPVNAQYLTDNSNVTCVEFTVSAQRKDVIFRLRVPDPPAKLVPVTLLGGKLGCGDDLFVMPITGADTANWKGIWIGCPLVKTSVTNYYVEQCQYSCRCAERCTEIQIMKRPRTQETWSVCDVRLQVGSAAVPQGKGKNVS